MDLEQTIRDAAEKFARKVVDTLRGMTLDELAGIVRSPVAVSTAAAPVRKARAVKAAPAKKPVVAKPVAKPAPKKLKISPARAAQLKLQGTYIGLIRGLPAAQKAAMKKIAAKSGMAAAVKAMRSKEK